MEEHRNLLKVILVDEGETDWNESINAFMLAEGIALLDRTQTQAEDTPEEVLAWQEYEEEARDNLLGLWQNEGNALVSDDDAEF